MSAKLSGAQNILSASAKFWKKLARAQLFWLSASASNFLSPLKLCTLDLGTLTRKNMNICTLLHTYVQNKFVTADHSCTTKYFWKILIEVGSSHLYASFGTFCVQMSDNPTLINKRNIFVNILNFLNFFSKQYGRVDFQLYPLISTVLLHNVESSLL